MKFISAAPVLFTTTVLVAWNATPALSAKVSKASATSNDKDVDIYAVDNKPSRRFQSSFCMDSPLDWYDIDGKESDCVWYSEGRRCKAFGETHGSLKKTAKEACCACGGGEYFPITAFTTKDELQEAVREYCNDPFEWENNDKFKIYGPIEDWNTSEMTDMTNAFWKQRNCNPNLAKWDVSKVTSFRNMFLGARSFNQDIAGWNVSSGTDFSFMFYGARSFNQDIGRWGVSSGTSFLAMFQYASSFNQDISLWIVSSGADFGFMFFDASAFNQDLCSWQMKSDADLDHFCIGAVNCGQCKKFHA